MAQPITLKQSIFLALELRTKYLANIEPMFRTDHMGRKHAAHLLNAIITTPEDGLEFDAVQRDLGYVMAVLIERRDANAFDLDALLDAAKAYDMTVKGHIVGVADPASLLANE